MGWSNVASAVLTANTVIVTADAAGTGVFVYSGTPATGNLVASITATSGTDPFGNGFTAGFSSYAAGGLLANVNNAKVILSEPGGRAITLNANPNAGTAVNLHPRNGTGETWSDGMLSVDFSPDTPDVPFTLLQSPTELGNIPGGISSLQLKGGGLASTVTRAILNATTIEMQATGTILADAPIVAANGSGVPFTWQTPAYKANWSASTVVNGLGGPALQFRRMPDDSVWIHGITRAAAGAGGVIFTLPAGYFPTTGGLVGTGAYSTTPGGGGTDTAVNFAVNITNGDFIVSNVVAGADYAINLHVPLFNVA